MPPRSQRRSEAGWRSVLQEPSGERHLVQFYRSQPFLQAAVGTWTAASLRRGGGAVLIGTPQHVDAVRAHLAGEGLDARALESEGRLAVRDAHAFMGTFTGAGGMDPVRFRAALDGVVEGLRAAAPRGELRAWGEMVDVLRRRGDVAGAKRLEGMWNDAMATRDFRLLCSYGVDNLDEATHGGLFRDLTESHASLIPEEDDALFEDAVWDAMAEVLGANEAPAFWDLFVARERVRMPPAEAALAGLAEFAPQMGVKVLLKTRMRLDARGAPVR